MPLLPQACSPCEISKYHGPLDSVSTAATAPATATTATTSSLPPVNPVSWLLHGLRTSIFSSPSSRGFSCLIYYDSCISSLRRTYMMPSLFPSYISLGTALPRLLHAPSVINIRV
ncbi:hypothetical protein BOTBODRAFT_217829 [Botryobasidium botryosum FD-172 SS1]|uniref:Uncharacterized protein n=1 Tax=Botryobasidium botryosum (strain FD-172 SS1) TaxID=930990 RepID=A0A067NCV1_BOTB1|nr:hypothetical protein BOTBODRAFT_217829 [Botryobasidium botryosum FD-172 SS1]